MEFPSILSNSGWIAVPLIFISMINLGLFLYTFVFLFSLRKSLQSPRDFALEFLFSADEENLKLTIESLGQIDIAQREYLLDRWESFTAPILRNASWINNLAAQATLLGLLGTVLGIQESFAAMQEMGKTTLDIFAGGVSRALSTTIFGLSIAIPSYLMNQYLKSELLQASVLFQDKLMKLSERNAIGKSKTNA
ncbi:MAG: MotA/TolQ/ExbB proton channel family protein [Leptospiraceae bacterium]|nr:MotA/TolQ/ExbB proton channel family protein [Leptospiraceae bacterium]